MSKKAILLVSFGTIDFQTRKKCIYNITENITDFFTDYKVFTAFSSKFIISKLKSMGENIFGVEDALDEILKADFSEVIIQPTFLTDGEEYHRLIKISEKYKDKIKIYIGKPILYYEEDYNKIALLLIKQTEKTKDTITVFMGHGNENIYGKTYFKIQETLDNMGINNIFITTVEGEPSFKTIVDKISKNTSVSLQPLMIVSGEHAKNDMAGNDDESLKNLFIKKGCTVSCIIKGLGEIFEISEIIREHIIKSKNDL